MLRNVLLHGIDKSCLALTFLEHRRTDQTPVLEKGVAIVDSLRRCQKHNYSPVLQDALHQVHIYACILEITSINGKSVLTSSTMDAHLC